MEVSIHELLAAAREAVKSDYIKGESILCETRYHPDTHCMVEIEMLKTDNTLGKKGAYGLPTKAVMDAVKRTRQEMKKAEKQYTR